MHRGEDQMALRFPPDADPRSTTLSTEDTQLLPVSQLLTPGKGQKLAESRFLGERLGEGSNSGS